MASLSVQFNEHKTNGRILGITIVRHMRSRLAALSYWINSPASSYCNIFLWNNNIESRRFATQRRISISCGMNYGPEKGVGCICVITYSTWGTAVSHRSLGALCVWKAGWFFIEYNGTSIAGSPQRMCIGSYTTPVLRIGSHQVYRHRV